MNKKKNIPKIVSIGSAVLAVISFAELRYKIISGFLSDSSLYNPCSYGAKEMGICGPPKLDSLYSGKIFLVSVLVLVVSLIIFFYNKNKNVKS